jgi:oxepin-CoA hydrolase/3-oxo-5,6-dehydrosuberyl-CoA semialdehyde dehydrogenase
MPFDVNDAALRDWFLRTRLPSALARLSPDQPPRWGRMTAQQMVEHLAWAFEVSTGRVEVDCGLPPSDRDAMKQFLYRNGPTPQNFMNPVLAAGLPPLRHATLDDARAALDAEVKRFFEERAADREPRTHPVFGAIGYEEWSRSHYKHSYHHLLQFGLISPMDAFAGRYEGSGRWHDSVCASMAYRIVQTIRVNDGGFDLAFTHDFDDGSKVDARFAMTWIAPSLFRVDSSGQQIGNGYCFDDYCHYHLQFGDRVVEASYRLGRAGLDVFGSSSRNADGNYIAWRERLRRSATADE